MKKIILLACALFGASTSIHPMMLSTNPEDYVNALENGPLKRACQSSNRWSWLCCCCSSNEEDAKNHLLTFLMLNDTALAEIITVHSDEKTSLTGIRVVDKAMPSREAIRDAIRTLLASEPDEVKWEEFDMYLRAVGNVKKDRRDRAALARVAADERRASGRGGF